MEGALYVTEKKKVARYRTIVTELMHQAHGHKKSLALLDEMIEKYSSEEPHG